MANVLRQDQKPLGGGFYGDFGLAIGPGFNLHFDRGGITPSVGVGLNGRALVGYATDEQALIGARDQNRLYGSVKAGRGLGVGGELNYKPRGRSVSIEGGSVSIGPVKVIVDKAGRFRLATDWDVGRGKGAPVFSADGKTFSLGLDGGGGLMYQLPTDRYGSGR